MLNIRILVVDDHGTLRKRIADYLRAQEGVEEVAEAANGVEALKCLRESRFDVMITDLVMPLMDGYMLLEELPRQIDPPPKTIVMSALSRDDFVTRAIDLGAVFYMVKPFEPEHLLSHIRDIQEERSVLPQAQAPCQAPRAEPRRAAGEPVFDHRHPGSYQGLPVPALRGQDGDRAARPHQPHHQGALSQHRPSVRHHRQQGRARHPSCH